MSLTASEEAATRQGIAALEEAQSSVSTAQESVEADRQDLTAVYRGVDGAKFSELLEKWNNNVNIIQKNLTTMIAELQNSMEGQQATQSQSVDGINTQSSQSDNVFDELSGH